MKDYLWKLFGLTGNIKYYLLYKEMESLEHNEQVENQGNNN